MYFESSRDTQTFYHQGDNRCTAHMHRSVEFLYVLEGEKRVWLNGKRYDLQSGDFILCPPYCVHRYEPAENGLQIVATIPTEHCEKFDELCKNALPQTHVLRDTEGELLRLIKALNNPPNVLFFSGVANLILGIFMAKVPFLPAQNGKERKLQNLSTKPTTNRLPFPRSQRGSDILQIIFHGCSNSISKRAFRNISTAFAYVSLCLFYARKRYTQSIANVVLTVRNNIICILKNFTVVARKNF